MTQPYVKVTETDEETVVEVRASTGKATVRRGRKKLVNPSPGELADAVIALVEAAREGNGKPRKYTDD